MVLSSKLFIAGIEALRNYATQMGVHALDFAIVLTRDYSVTFREYGWKEVPNKKGFLHAKISMLVASLETLLPHPLKIVVGWC